MVTQTRILILFLLAGLVHAASPGDYFIAYKATTLNSAAEKITIQQPTSSAKRVQVDSATVYCSAACTLTFSRNGTAASTTSFTPLALSNDSPSATVRAYSASNAGTGTALFVHTLPAGSTCAFDLTGVSFAGATATQNFSVATGSMTGDVRVIVKWREE